MAQMAGSPDRLFPGHAGRAAQRTAPARLLPALPGLPGPPGPPAARVAGARLGVYDILRAWEDGHPAPTGVPPTVLCFGRLGPYKGLETLYSAAPLVARQVPDVRFIVAGKPVAGYELPRPPTLPFPAALEVQEGYIPNARLAQLLGAATVVACPYHEATQSAVLLTAFAFDRPVVASAVGGLGEYIRDGVTGLLIPPGDPESLAAALVRVLTDDMLRSRLCQGIRRAREAGPGWSQAAEQTLAVYTGLLAEQDR